MKKVLALLLTLSLLLCALPAMADGDSRLTSLTHNCPNTGVMLPSAFNPNQTTYILTVASWVSRVNFTPTAAGTIYVNGTQVASGTACANIQMTNEPQQVTIQVVNGSSSTTYTIFLQRRPSERRTRVSAGYINSIYQSNDKYYLAADLVTVNYKSNKYADGTLSSFTNDSSYLYKYPISTHCVFYVEQNGQTVRCSDVFDFQTALSKLVNPMFRIVYIEDEIVAVLPYSADY